MKSMIEAALFTPLRSGRWGLPMLFWGPPGVGKTEMIRQVCKAYGLYMEHLTPGERGEGAFGVTPVPIQNGHGLTITYPPPDWIHNLRENEEECGVVFLDEINTAPPALQPALLGAIQERRIGGHQFNNRVRVVGAANPPNQSAGGWDIAPPVANRLGHITWPAVDTQEWINWLISDTTKVDLIESASVREMRMLKEWPSFVSQARTEVASFIQRKPGLLFKLEEGNHAWPSPRSWTNAVDALASARFHKLNELEQQIFVSAFVGNAALEFFNWLVKQDLPNPYDILSEKITWKPSKRKLDEVQAVLEGLTDIVVNHSVIPEALLVYWRTLEAVMTHCGEDVVLKHVKAVTKNQANYFDIGPAKRVIARVGNVLERLKPRVEVPEQQSQWGKR